MMTHDQRIEATARAIAKSNGDDYDLIPANKPEWNAARGQFGGRFRGVNEPYKSDYDEMAEAAIAAYLGDDVVVPRDPTPEMIAAALDAPALRKADLPLTIYLAMLRASPLADRGKR